MAMKKASEALSVSDKANKPLPKRLQQLITNAAALSEHLGCSVQAVNQYKQGIAAPQLDKLIKISEFYNVSVDYLLGITETPNRDTTVQAVCEYTGLDELVVNRLHNIGPQMRAGIGILLSSDACDRFLLELYLYLSGRKSKIKAPPKQEDKSKLFDIEHLNEIEKAGFDIIPRSISASMHLTSACDILKDIFRKVGDEIG